MENSSKILGHLGSRLKGDRTYYHGTDMVDELADFIGRRFLGQTVTDLDLSIHRFAHSVPAVLADRPTDTEPFAVCSFTIDGRRKRLYLIETGDEIIDRIEYSEHKIEFTSRINEQTLEIMSNASLDFTNIERWVAMVKILHGKVYKDLLGNWIFVRGRFQRYDHQTNGVEHRIFLAANFNQKLTRSDVFLDGIKAGEIYFAII